MSKNKINQQKEERFYLEKFLPLIGISKAGIMIGDDPPDFVVTYDDNKVAIEVTEFHSDFKGEKGYPRRVIEEAWKELSTAIAVERKNIIKLHNINCTLYFDKFIVPSRKERVAFAKELVSFVKSVLSRVSKVQVEYEEFHRDNQLLSKYLRKITIKKVGCYITWGWNHSAGMVGLRESELKAVVEEKLISIKRSFDEIWLLIVSGVEISQCMGMPSVEELRGFIGANDFLNKTPYSNVFIYQYLFDRVIEWTKQGGWRMNISKF